MFLFTVNHPMAKEMEEWEKASMERKKKGKYEIKTII